MSIAHAAEPPERAPQSGTRSMPATPLAVTACDSHDMGRAGSWLLRPIVLYREAPASGWHCPSRIFGGGRVLSFVKRIYLGRSAAGIGQPVGFGRNSDCTDAAVARQPKSDIALT